MLFRSYAFVRDGLLLLGGEPVTQGISLEGTLSGFVKYNLADGLWVYSLTALMILLWCGGVSWEGRFWILSGLVVAVVSEICQAFGGLPGTFDPVDMLCYVVAFIAANVNLYFSK